MEFSCGSRSAIKLIVKATWGAHYRFVSCKAFLGVVIG